MKFSLRLNNDLPVEDYVKIAKVAEHNNFDQFWVSDDLFLRSAPVILSAVAVATERIEIGTCILNPYTIHPAEIAMFAATLDELSNGRFNLGISSGASNFLNWIGIETPTPRTTVVNAIMEINHLLSGGKSENDYHPVSWTNEAYLRFKPRRRVPIYLGAMSPRMLREIGAIADGGLPLLFPPEHYANVLPYIQDGADTSGRKLTDIDIAACIWCSIAEDQDKAEDVLKEKVAYYGYSMSDMILGNLGLTKNDFQEIENLVSSKNDLDKAKSLVTPAMLKIGVAGTADTLINRINYLIDMGVQHISFGPPLGPDVLKAVEIIGREVIPKFKAQHE